MNQTSTAGSVRFTSPLLDAHVHTRRATALPLTGDEHVVALRRLVRERAIDIKLSLVDQTKLVTAASELARNTIKYGGGGEARLIELDDGSRQGVQLIFADDGPGIADPALERAPWCRSSNGSADHLAAAAPDHRRQPRQRYCPGAPRRPGAGAGTGLRRNPLRPAGPVDQRSGHQHHQARRRRPHLSVGRV